MKKLIVESLLLLMGVVSMWGQGGSLVLNSPPPTNVQQVFVSTTGVTGNTQWCYWVVAVYATGMSLPSSIACTNVANATLTGGNFNTVSWNPPPGAAPTGYWVIASNSNSFPGTGATSVSASVQSSSTFTLNQTSNTLNSFTYSGAPTTTVVETVDGTINPGSAVVFSNSAANDMTFTPNTPVINTSNLIKIPFNVLQISGNATLAQINAGITILPAIANRTYRIVGFQFLAAGGTFAGCTLVQIADTAGSPVVSVGIPVADLTTTTVATPAAAGITYTTYAWQGALTASQGVQLNKTGGSCTTATSLNYSIQFTLN